MTQKMSGARRAVLAFAAITILGWLLGIAGVSRLPSSGYVVADLVLDVLMFVGLWLLWRPAWVVAIVLTVLGELLLVIHPSGHSALLAIGLAQLAILALPQLRRRLATRPATTLSRASPGRSVRE